MQNIISKWLFSFAYFMLLSVYWGTILVSGSNRVAKLCREDDLGTAFCDFSTARGNFDHGFIDSGSALSNFRSIP